MLVIDSNYICSYEISSNILFRYFLRFITIMLKIEKISINHVIDEFK